MNPLEYSIEIKATPEKIWNTLWDDTTYRKWVSVFHEGSYYVTDWKKGSSVQFLNLDGNGVYGLIHENIPYQYLSIHHLGEVKNHINLPIEDSNYSDVFENYTLSEIDNYTYKLVVQLTNFEAYQTYFDQTFPLALAKVKELAEAND